MKFLTLIYFILAALAFGEHEHRNHGSSEHSEHLKNRGKIFLLPSDCSEKEVWDPISAMCMPRPVGDSMTHLMLHGTIFGVGISQSGPRGEDGFASTQMLMTNLGTTLGERNYLNLGLMLTGEKWTLPSKGYLYTF